MRWIMEWIEFIKQEDDTSLEEAATQWSTGWKLKFIMTNWRNGLRKKKNQLSH